MCLCLASVAIASLLLVTTTVASAQNGAPLTAPEATASITATASARVLERPARIVAADLARNPHHRPEQSDLVERPCDAGAPPSCRMLVVELP